jgi:hypothetical protein
LNSDILLPTQPGGRRRRRGRRKNKKKKEKEERKGKNLFQAAFHIPSTKS